MFCTYAVTGSREQWQPIFICHDCCTAEEENQCICDACSDQCHQDHNVEYIGMGPSYCDCGKDEKCCKIIEDSRLKAQELDCGDHIANVESVVVSETPKPVLESQVSRIPELENTDTCTRLKRQAKILSTLSRDTFWLDFDESPDELCELEQLALQILKWHTTTRELDNMVGAEWWVQVKDLASNAAVDLHYDKDEKLAESFGLANFPLISTVSYLGNDGYPTLVLPHRYDESEEHDMDFMLMSHPRPGKHLLFDGRLLHGAPAHPDLLLGEARDKTNLKGYRVTFLVNLWQETKPKIVNRLSSDIRDELLNDWKENGLGNHGSFEITMENEDIASISVLSEDDLPVDRRVRIILPFVSEGATWIEDGDDGPDLVLMTFACPKHNFDTVNVAFGPGMQSYLEYIEDDNDVDQDAIYEPVPYAEDYV